MDRSVDWIEERSVTSGYDIDRVSLFLFGVTAFLIVELFERDWNFLITCLNWTELPPRLDVDSWAMSHDQWLTLYLHWYNLAFRLNKDKYFLFDLRLRAVGSFTLDGWKYHIIKKGMGHQLHTWIALCSSKMKQAWVEEFGSHWITIIEALSLKGFEIIKYSLICETCDPLWIKILSYRSFIIYFLKRSFVVILCCHINNLKLTSSESDGNS